MRFTLIVVILLQALVHHGQSDRDTIKTTARSDISFFLMTTTRESTGPHREYVYSFISDAGVRDPSFFQGFSDTAARRPNFHRHRGDGVYRSDNVGSVATQLGFRFGQYVSKRIKITSGFYYSKRTFFAYNMHRVDLTATDTVYYTDPAYPPIIEYSRTYRNLYYRYVSRMAFLEAGGQYDYLSTPGLKLYAGVRVAFSRSIKNTLYVRRQVLFDSSAEPLEVEEMKIAEKPSSGSRVCIPMGIQLGRGRYSVFAELAPGYEKYQITGGRELPNAICEFSWGLKISL